MASTRTATDGGFTFRVTFPGARDYRVVAPPLSQAKGQTAIAYAASAVTTVRAATGGGGGGSGDDDTGGLPITGAPVAWVAAAGGVLVALGALLLLAGRLRRRDARPTADRIPADGRPEGGWPDGGWSEAGLVGG